MALFFVLITFMFFTLINSQSFDQLVNQEINMLSNDGQAVGLEMDQVVDANENTE